MDLFILLVGALLMAIFVVDMSTMTIPNRFVIALIPFAILSVFLFPEIGLTERIVGFCCVSIPMLLVALIISNGFGGGDIKLMAVCGFMLGWKFAILVVCSAFILSGAVAVLLLIVRRAKGDSFIPFGPALCISCFSALLLLSWNH